MKSINLFGQRGARVHESQKVAKKYFRRLRGLCGKIQSQENDRRLLYASSGVRLCFAICSRSLRHRRMTVVRPFYPGGDYESLVYPDNCVVIDNPPFSIVSQIVRFYLKRGIKFFLFAPYLTLFSADLDCTRIVCGAAIVLRKRGQK